MDSGLNGQLRNLYEQPDDLALRSAVGDPTVEPRSNPQTQSREHTKSPSISTSKTTRIGSRSLSESQSTKASQSWKVLVNRAESEQLQANEALKTNEPKGKGMKPKDAQASHNDTTLLSEIITKRNDLFDRLKREQQAAILAKEKPEINVVLEFGKDKEGKSRPDMPVAAKLWESTPGSFLRHLDKDISSDVVAAKVDGHQLWDLDRPLEYPCRVSYLPFSSAEGRNVFWHSSAHVLGEAAECQFDCLLSHGPPVEQGFFYDMAMAEG